MQGSIISIGLSKATLSEADPETLNTTFDLANLCYDGGDLDRALKLYLVCLDKRKATLGADHVDTVNTMNNLAGLYTELGRHTKALPLMLDCEKLTAAGSKRTGNAK